MRGFQIKEKRFRPAQEQEAAAYIIRFIVIGQEKAAVPPKFKVVSDFCKTASYGSVIVNTVSFYLSTSDKQSS